MSISKSVFGSFDGHEVSLYKLSNTRDSSVEILDYGGYLKSWKIPCKSGEVVDVLLGYDQLEDYLKDTTYTGCLVGRVCSRIKRGKFSLDGKTYSLVCNNGPNHLHGGTQCFSRKLWTSKIVDEKLRLSYISIDGEEGYPGRLECHVTFELTNENELKIEYVANTTAATPVNLTCHAYFNLCGEGTPTVEKHEVTIFSDKSLPTDEESLVTVLPLEKHPGGTTQVLLGEIEPVERTLSDLRQPVQLKTVLHKFSDPNKHFPSGYDRYFCVENDRKLKLVSRARSLTTHIELEVYTNQPGVNFYTGAYLNQVGKGGKKYGMQSGLCFETHGYPDAVNNAHFPSVILTPDQTYHHSCIYKCQAK